MPNDFDEHTDPIRKAAILISTLDHRVADALLERMSEDQAARVRRVAMELDEIPADEQERILQEFLGSAEHRDRREANDDGVELAVSLAHKLAAAPPVSEKGSDPLRRDKKTSEIDSSFKGQTAFRSGSEDAYHCSEPTSEEVPFQFLREASPRSVAKHLQHENPQVVAIVVAHLPPRQAADLLQHFEPAMQANVLRRVAELDTADREIVREVEQHLKEALSLELRMAKNRAVGLSTVASILTAAGEARGQLVSSLTTHARSLTQELGQTAKSFAASSEERDRDASAPQIPKDSNRPHLEKPAGSQQTTLARANPLRERMPTREEHFPENSERTANPQARTIVFTFDELSQLSDHALARIFRQADSKLSLLALAGASPPFVERLLRQLPPREAIALRKRMEQLGPMRLSDIEQAQVTIARLAAELIEVGEIARPRLESFVVAA